MKKVDNTTKRTGFVLTLLILSILTFQIVYGGDWIRGDLHRHTGFSTEGGYPGISNSECPSEKNDPNGYTIFQFKIVSLDLKNSNNKNIIELLDKKILPFIFLKVDYLNESGIKNIKVYDGGEEWWHCVVICGFDESNEKVFIYDPLLTYTESTLNENNCKVKISYALLTKYWKTTNNRLFWLVSQKGGKYKEKNALLQSFFKTGDM